MNQQLADNLSQHEGWNEASSVAFACFADGIDCEGFSKMSMEDKVADAAGNAGLGVEDLIKALRFLGRYQLTRAKQLEAYRDSHGHA